MPKTPPKPVEISKIVPLTQEKHRVIARDEKSQRVILTVGKQRVAFDFFTRITNLPPHTGDRPAPVLPMSRKHKEPVKGEK
jgi:hypothetical protein